jgi:hypothetical protein
LESAENDLPQHNDFAANILPWIDKDNDYLNKVCFSDEATFHILGKANGPNSHIW